MSEPAWQSSSKQRLQIALISGVGYPLVAALGATYRFTVDGLEHLRAAEALGRPIHAFWHGRILAGTIYFRHRGIVVITSENFDGEWIARIITKFGFATARGSSTRGAMRAMLQMVRDTRDKSVAFTVDGPRGPARVAQPGAVWLSKASGNPIIPFHAEANRAWTIKSWDAAQIPKPFATIALAFAPPIVVPRDVNGDGIDRYCRLLEDALAHCAGRCDDLLRTE